MPGQASKKRHQPNRPVAVPANRKVLPVGGFVDANAPSPARRSTPFVWRGATASPAPAPVSFGNAPYMSTAWSAAAAARRPPQPVVVAATQAKPSKSNNNTAKEVAAAAPAAPYQRRRARVPNAAPVVWGGDE